MAEFARVTPEGWQQGDDATSFARITPQGWAHLEAVAAAGAFTTIVSRGPGPGMAVAGEGGLAP